MLQVSALGPGEIGTSAIQLFVRTQPSISNIPSTEAEAQSLDIPGLSAAADETGGTLTLIWKPRRRPPPESGEKRQEPGGWLGYHPPLPQKKPARVGIRFHAQFGSFKAAPLAKTKTAPGRREPLLPKKLHYLPEEATVLVSNDALLKGAAQILVRVHGNVVDAHFIVKMRPGRAARLAHIADHLSAGHVLALAAPQSPRDVRTGSESRAHDQHDLAPIPGAHRRSAHIAVCRGAYRRSVRRFDVNAGVKFAFSVERIFPLAKA